MKRPAIAVAAIVMLAGCARVPKKPDSMTRGDYSYVKEYITWLVKKEMKKQDVTGLSIALVDDQQVVWAEGFGFADKANKVPATPETIYRAGSISKLFTATMAMQLVEQGKLDIDKPLQSYLPEFSIRSRFPDAGPITPRNIMTHHSGLPSDFSKGMWAEHPEPFENVVNQIRDEYVASPPNYVFSYSNVGATLLGHALEKVAGRDFAVHMEASVLRPLGMTHSTFSQAPDRSLLGTKAYRNGNEVEEFSLRDIPAGGLNSNVLDLSRFMQMVFAGGWAGERQIIKPETLAEMLRPQNTEVPLDLNFRIGLAWMLSGLGSINARDAGPIAHHGGATRNHHSLLVVLPGQKLGVVVMSNSATGGPVVNKAAIEALKLALEAKTGIKRPVQAKTATGERALAQDALQKYEGRYATVFGVVNVTRGSGYLRTEIMGTSFRLVPRPDGMLGLQRRLLGIRINLGQLGRIGISQATIDGRVIVKTSMDGEEVLVGERIRAVPIPGAWQKRAGEYEIVNAGDDAALIDKIRLRQDNGLLLVEFSSPLSAGWASRAIMPLSDSEALFNGLGRGMGETIRSVSSGGEELLQYSGYLLRKKQNQRL
ncbi:MAG TPA: serine hydrolase domain-containing protein [Anaeromyxobacteraceae bacterium]|nr:serine hydrolase domain-containing protein [Anaeromyxobacteraceae bacterium]